MIKTSKKIISAIISMAICLMCMPLISTNLKVNAATTLLISSVGDLEEFRDRVNAGETTLNAVLTKNIKTGNSPTNQWIPIGFKNSNSCTQYDGVFEGNGFSITGIYVNDECMFQGLFSMISTSGVVKNVGVGGYINGELNVGGITSVNKGSILNCYNNAAVSVKGNHGRLGGIAGENYGEILNCYNTGVIMSSGNYCYTGGICGYIYGDKSLISSCYNVGKVGAKADSDSKEGGICGLHSYTTLENNYSLDSSSKKALGYSTAGYITSKAEILSDEQMKGANSMKNMIGFDFDNVWHYTDSYPLLRIQKNLNLKLGDINDDGIIDSFDSSMILTEYACISSNKTSDITDIQRRSADVNSDGIIDSYDSSLILSYYAYKSSNGIYTLEKFLAQN